MGSKTGTYTYEVVMDVRVDPDGNQGTVVERLTNLRQVKVTIAESEVPALVVGHEHIAMLSERKNESLEFKVIMSPDEKGKIDQRLQDVVDAARLQGIPEAGIAEGFKLSKPEFPDMAA